MPLLTLWHNSAKIRREEGILWEEEEDNAVVIRAAPLFLLVLLSFSSCPPLLSPPLSPLLFLPLLSDGVPVRPVKCPQGHGLQLSDRDTGWTCDGQPGEGGPCRGGRNGAARGRLPIRFRCQSCDYDLCHPCYEAKGQGI